MNSIRKKKGIMRLKRNISWHKMNLTSKMRHLKNLRKIMKEVLSIQSNCLEELVMKMKNIYKTLKN